MPKTLKLIEKYLLYLIVLLLPILVLPVFPDPFGLPKLLLLLFSLSLFLIIKVVEIFRSNSFEVSTTQFDLPLIALGLAYLVSGLFGTPNKAEAFFSPGPATFMVAGVILYLLIHQTLPAPKKALKVTLFFSSLVVALFSLLAVSGILAKVPQLPPFMKEGNFTPLGNPLATLIYIVAILPLGIDLIFDEKEVARKAFYSMSLVIIALASIILVITMLPGKATSLLLPDFRTGSTILFDSLKENPIFGVGPGNYLTAFNRFRPISYNSTSLWSARFTQSRSFPLTLLTETGLIGGVAFVITFMALVKYLRGARTLTPELISLLLLLVLTTLFPPSPVVLVLFFILFSFLGSPRRFQVSLPSRSASIIISASLLILIGYFNFRLIPAVGAEMSFKKAIDSLAKNQAEPTYNLLKEAINTNPYVDRYHASYAQVNLAIARSLAQKPDVSEEERNTISQLIQQAIREGKSTAFLNPQRAGNWELLGSIYRSIMPLAQGADQFAIQAYQQAVALDPINPELRIALGGVYYALGNYTDAIEAFKFATLAKADHANAHYNLAVAYREKGEIEAAIKEMRIVLSLVKEGTEDYNLAKTTLQELESKKPAKETGPAENLEAPAAEEPLLTPPLELPQEATPSGT